MDNARPFASLKASPSRAQARRVTFLLRDYEFRIDYGPGDDPLRNFYIPALSRSIRYDRMAGFFSSTALAVAAEGVAHLIRNGGRMRLLVGAKLSDEDVSAIKVGYDLRGRIEERLLESLPDPEDALLRKRLEALAWMVAEGTLDVKVVLPSDESGNPLPASISQEYFHPKEGVFTDSGGNRVAFSGSINESERAWMHNYERFMVYRSWDESRKFLLRVVHHFDSLWGGGEEGWITIPFPDAVKKRLLRFRPGRAPAVDPLEVLRPPRKPSARDALLLQFVKDAPYLPNGYRAGEATSAIRPFPHQRRIADTLVERFPESFMICDEVGLGKTIEVGLALRGLIVSGRVRRALLLVPRSIARQWQEELWEKFLLNALFYDGKAFHDYFKREMDTPGGNPWSAYPLILASSQLAKRRDRRGELLESGPWDLIVVDEAHHARRREFATDRYRPNRLLELLEGLRGRTKSLWLVTATPMQIDPIEVWDLLRLAGVGGRWGASEENFRGYFEELRKAREDFESADWGFILRMLAEEVGEGFDPVFREQAERELGLVAWRRIEELPNSSRVSTAIDRLSREQRAFLLEMCRRHTPLRRKMFRYTRRLLRRYREGGLIQARIPRRRVEQHWLDMTREERELYRRIEEYISEFYHKYESERKGLGFVMTVYRRRLTSSFYALRRSLERRMAFILGELGEVFQDDDLEQEDLESDVTELLSDVDRRLFEEEMRYLEGFLRDLRKLGGDSKAEFLLRHIREILGRRESVIVFTQYTDTMDYLRDRLRVVYGNQVACYSGRGGEVWDGEGWVPTSKERIKGDFRDGRVPILLGTQALSEGLNLQTCGVLINYDMPWNPMRVEQRIGRIDRIGQEHDEVWVENYFYSDTVEAIVYKRLSDRIDWFREVVGELQPILARVARVIESAAMATGEERRDILDSEISRLREEIEERRLEALPVYEGVEAEPRAESESPPPVTLKELEGLLISLPQTRGLFRPHPEMPNAYILSLKGEEHAVTFDPELFDAHPGSLRLMVYGEPLLEEVLEGTESGPPSDAGVIRLEASEPRLVAYYAVEPGGGIHRIETLGQLDEVLRSSQRERIAREGEEQAREDFSLLVSEKERGEREFEERRRLAELSALEERARRMLVRASYVEIVRGERRSPFSEGVSPFSRESVVSLAKRYRYPFAGLIKLLSERGAFEEIELSPKDPLYLELQGESGESLEGKFRSLRERAGEVLNGLAEAMERKQPEVQ